MALVCAMCGRKKKRFGGPAFYQCKNCGAVYCADCRRKFGRKGGFLGFGAKPACPRCGSTEWRKV
ncbi:hypothetical protein [Pyrococcus sp. NA2]|uniref:hypothetical protein n=1 Tax=Pyrococcus sp. (strain NA2) TaxID=342949 RepID=UPI00064E87B7|nr:hypothetical protein [Pyrococcus sp. NA2]